MFFIGNENDDKQTVIFVLLLVNLLSDGVSCMKTNKDAMTQISQFVRASLDWRRHTDMILRHDQEHTLDVLTRLIKKILGHNVY